MLFNSIEFAIFLSVVFILYWFVFNKNLKLQNLFLLIASFIFYGWWDWRFLFLLVISIGLVYFPGKLMCATQKLLVRKFWFWFSVLISIGFLGVFKYYNFFIDSFKELMVNFGMQVNMSSLRIILPVGISFYTFHGLSYIIDLYKNKIEEEKSFINYALFVSFFPLLVAGPIERATHLLPQIKTTRIFNYNKAVDGLRQILWGLFKKIVIADNCAIIANNVFDNYHGLPSSSLLIGALCFSLQIYCDFSGYSDIALGTARLLGIELLRNFSFPYFSRDIAEFWRRWHISLTTWFRDYIYIPLGGSRGSKWQKVRNTMIIFLVSGFWHGANWTYIIWGGYHALLFFPLIIMEKNRRYTNTIAEGKHFPTIIELGEMLVTFIMVVIGWIIFRSDNIGHAIDYIHLLFSRSLISIPTGTGLGGYHLIVILFSTLLLLILEWLQRDKQHGLEIVNSPFILRWSLYSTLLLVVIYCFNSSYGNSTEFIYFQF